MAKWLVAGGWCALAAGGTHRRGGAVEQWNSGAVEQWNSGAMEQWNSGAVEPWSRGAVDGCRWLVRTGGGGTTQTVSRQCICNSALSPSVHFKPVDFENSFCKVTPTRVHFIRDLGELLAFCGDLNT